MRVLIFLLCLFSPVYICSDGTMNLVLFDSNTGAVCNDGSPAGFYWRPGTGDGMNQYVIHLQGGAWCYDEESCADRWYSSPDLMSSNGWDSSIYMSEGLFSLNKDDNSWYNANSVYVMYCSSDVWAGNGISQYTNSTNQWQFKGKQIISTLVDTLWANYNLQQAEQILFSGCSAGGQGVIVNLDYFSALMKEKQPNNIVIKGFADAGWLQNLVPYFPDEISASYQMQQGYKMWGGVVEKTCALANPGWEWLCYFSPFAYPYISTPIFIQTEQFDTYQVTSNSGYPPYDTDEWDYVKSIRYAFDNSLQMIKNNNSYFSAACFHHCSSEDNSYNTIKINGYSLSQTLSNWFYSTGEPIKGLDTCTGFNCSIGCPVNSY